MHKLTDPRLIAMAIRLPETGMGYTVMDVVLKDRRLFKQVVMQSGWINVRGHDQLPFSEDEIDHFVATHEK